MTKNFLLLMFLPLILFSQNIAKKDQEKQLPKFYFSQMGEASYYGPEFNNRKTSSGEIYNQNNFTAAHPFLAFGTSLKVTNLKNNKSTIVRVNDRGPFKKGRVLDLSYAAANDIGLVKHGTAQVKIETVSEPEEGKLDEVVLFDEDVLKGEEFYVHFSNEMDSAKIDKIITANGKLKIGLYRQRKQLAGDLKPHKDTSVSLKPRKITEVKTPGYAVQVGAFVNYDNAEELLQSLVDSRYDDVEIISVKEKDNIMYKVLIGNCKKQEEAAKLKNKLLKDNIIGFIIKKGN